MLQLPSAEALILCEKAIIEDRTRNVTLVSTVYKLRSREFPARSQQLAVYALLTDGVGQARMALAVSRLDTLEDIFTYRWRKAFRDPLARVKIILRFSGFEFPAP